VLSKLATVVGALERLVMSVEQTVVALEVFLATEDEKGKIRLVGGRVYILIIGVRI